MMRLRLVWRNSWREEMTNKSEDDIDVGLREGNLFRRDFLLISCFRERSVQIVITKGYFFDLKRK